MAARVWRIEEFVEIDSTNSYLVARARDGAPEGLVARADFQTAGRGRLDRRWEAPPRSGLLASLLFRPGVASEQHYLAAVAVALSARAALVRLCGLRPDLKWPNDLVVGDRKVGGLLGESVVDAQGRDAVVVGIGVNLTTDGPPGVGGTSVFREAGVTIEPRALLDLLIDEVEPRLSWLDDDRDRLLAEFGGALATVGRAVRVEMPGGTVEGTATGIDGGGRLIVRTESEERVVSVGDVVHLRTPA